jgi:hypothetical protein
MMAMSIIQNRQFGEFVQLGDLITRRQFGNCLV